MLTSWRVSEGGVLGEEAEALERMCRQVLAPSCTSCQGRCKEEASKKGHSGGSALFPPTQVRSHPCQGTSADRKLLPVLEAFLSSRILPNRQSRWSLFFQVLS